MIQSLTLAVAAVAAFNTLATTEAHGSPRNPGLVFKPFVVYGEDDRKDLYQIDDPAILKLADSTVALFRSEKIEIDPALGIARLATEAYGEEGGMCTDEPFFEQRNGAFCSGSLVGPDLLLTAGHCVESLEECMSTKFVFGFAIREQGAPSPESVPASEVYGCAGMVQHVYEGMGADFAVIKLDRIAEGHEPLKINRLGDAPVGAELFVIGHPAGLPVKFAGGAVVRSNDSNGYFVANLDTYGGNSGSAVFNAETHEIEGVLVRGERDYAYDDERSCRLSNVCTNEGCRGEDVTKISSIAEYIPEIPDGFEIAQRRFSSR